MAGKNSALLPCAEPLSVHGNAPLPTTVVTCRTVALVQVQPVVQAPPPAGSAAAAGGDRLPDAVRLQQRREAQKRYQERKRQMPVSNEELAQRRDKDRKLHSAANTGVNFTFASREVVKNVMCVDADIFV